MGAPHKGHWSENWPRLVQALEDEDRRTEEFAASISKLLSGMPGMPGMPGMLDTFSEIVKARRARPTEVFDELTPSLGSYLAAAEQLAVRAVGLSLANKEVSIQVRKCVALAASDAGLSSFPARNGRRKRIARIVEDPLADTLSLKTLSVGLTSIDLDELRCYAQSDAKGAECLVSWALPPVIEMMPDGAVKESFVHTYIGQRRAGKSPADALEIATLTHERKVPGQRSPTVPVIGL